MSTASIDTWKELISHLIIDREMPGQKVFQPFVNGQNIKVACLEIFNQRNLEYDNINQCINKLHQAQDQYDQILSKLSKY